MFEATRTHARLFKKAIEAIKEITNECIFNVSGTGGVHVKAMSTTHISLIILVLYPDMFEHYRCDQNINLSIDLKKFSKVLSWASNNDEITLSANDEAKTLNIKIESYDRNRLCEFAMKLIDIEEEFVDIPDTEYAAIIQMPTVQFKRICNDLALLGDNIIILICKDKVFFSVAENFGNGSIIEPHSEETNIFLTGDPFKMEFSLRHLRLFCKPALNKRVSIHLLKDVPICVRYELSGGYLEYHLAPRLDSEYEE
jgi:proliferating cell nuclear antigen